jgi:imidazolonepropionase-like amidohydrolase
MMKKNESGTMTRRQLMQVAATSALCLALPNISGCYSVPKYKALTAGDNQALELINCNVIDVVLGVVRQNKTITIRRGIIEAISDKMPPPQEGSLIFDVKNQYLIPGLIDAHCHSIMPSESQFDPFGVLTTMRQIKRNYVQQLTHGVTTIRDMGALPKMLQDNLEAIERGEMAGPRVVYCNAFTNVFGGHPDIDPADIIIFSGIIMAIAGNPSLWFKDIPELEEKMKLNVAGGASFIKLTMDKKSVMCGRGDIPAYKDEHLRVIMEFAQKHDLPTAGHIHTKYGFDRALQYGINSMEHTIADAELTDQEVSQMAKKSISIVPTMIIAQMLAAEEAYDELPKQFQNDFIINEMDIRRQYLNSSHDDYVEPSIHKNNVSSLKNYKKYGCNNLYKNGKFQAQPEIYFNVLLRGPKNTLKMKRAGVNIGCGTDSGVPFMYHGSLWREMEMLGRIGFSNKEVLQCATINNARILRMADKIGTIEKWKFADMVAFKENPLVKIEACRAPQVVIKGGRVYDVAKKE